MSVLILLAPTILGLKCKTATPKNTKADTVVLKTQTTGLGWLLVSRITCIDKNSQSFGWEISMQSLSYYSEPVLYFQTLKVLL